MNWNTTDYIVFGLMIAAALVVFKLSLKKTDNTAYRLGSGLAITGVFLLLWVNLAVGFIGSENNPANLMYVGVFGVGVISASIGRFRPKGMFHALIATALAQALVAGIAQFLGYNVWLPTIVFMLIWLGSALLYRKALSTH